MLYISALLPEGYNKFKMTKEQKLCVCDCGKEFQYRQSLYAHRKTSTNPQCRTDLVKKGAPVKAITKELSKPEVKRL